ncbi:MAG: hypothetical protein HY791_01640 [Deltaproteobacteria bacterium]|nr:hypothetical protein [Deltaproteobacteria bacterium]
MCLLRLATVVAFASIACAEGSAPTPPTGTHACTKDSDCDKGRCVESGGEHRCVSLCTEYCDTMVDVCTGASAPYADRGSCDKACGTFPSSGAPGDSSGDSVHCRAFHAQAASSDPRTHCAHASIGGGGVCGDSCEIYCRMIQTACTGANAQYADVGSCLTECATMELGHTQEGDTLSCRLYHLGAALSDPGAHCGHAGADGAGVCGSTCEVYCRRMEGACKQPQTRQYSDLAACLGECAAMPADGSAGDLSGDSVQCRMTHARAALADPAAHCSHAGPTGGAACGSFCDVYCRQAAERCTGADDLFANDSACGPACAAYSDRGAVGSDSGDTVQCRLFHLGAARTDATHCAHAAPDGGGVCQ